MRLLLCFFLPSPCSHSRRHKTRREADKGRIGRLAIARFDTHRRSQPDGTQVASYIEQDNAV